MNDKELKIIDEFIDGFEPWQSNLETMKKMRVGDNGLPACFICGIDPNKVKELRDAVEKLRNQTPANPPPPSP